LTTGFAETTVQESIIENGVSKIFDPIAPFGER